MNFIAGLLIGIVLGAAIGIFMVCRGKINKEQEAYREGYEDGMANANKNNMEG